MHTQILVKKYLFIWFENIQMFVEEIFICLVREIGGQNMRLNTLAKMKQALIPRLF
jgi:hypothetical protein